MYIYAGDNLQDEANAKYTSTANRCQGIRNLEAATICRFEDGTVDAECRHACCPRDTCDTAPPCHNASYTGEKNFEIAPRAMKSRVVLEINANENRLNGSALTPWAGEDKVREDKTGNTVSQVFGTHLGGKYGRGMSWKVEGFFMINEYHMALINDNDFGLRGNTHVQIAIVQLKNRIHMDPCLLSPRCNSVTGTPDCPTPPAATTPSPSSPPIQVVIVEVVMWFAMAPWEFKASQDSFVLAIAEAAAVAADKVEIASVEAEEARRRHARRLLAAGSKVNCKIEINEANAAALEVGFSDKLNAALLKRGLPEAKVIGITILDPSAAAKTINKLSPWQIAVIVCVCACAIVVIVRVIYVKCSHQKTVKEDATVQINIIKEDATAVKASEDATLQRSLDFTVQTSSIVYTDYSALCSVYSETGYEVGSA